MAAITRLKAFFRRRSSSSSTTSSLRGPDGKALLIVSHDPLSPAPLQLESAWDGVTCG